MMRFFSCFAIVLIGLISTPVLDSENKARARSPEDSHLKWEGERLTGELKKAPVRTLLEELAQEKNFQLVIVGDLNKEIDVSFDRLTLEQSIKKIMRVTDLSYFMILNEAGSPDKESPYRIKKLIICQKGRRSSASPTRRAPPRPRRKSVDKPDESQPLEQEEGAFEPAEPPHELQEGPETVSRRPRAEFEGTPEDLREYVEKLSSEKAISPEEYEAILENVEQRQPGE